MSYNKKYTIVDFPNNGQNYGTFTGMNAKKAASKAFSALIKFVDNNDQTLGKFIVFVIKNKDTGKMYKYIGSRILLEKPITVYKNGKNIIYKYKNIIGKYKEELNKI